jgi:hypothetical protein
VKVYFSV